MDDPERTGASGLGTGIDVHSRTAGEDEEDEEEDIVSLAHCNYEAFHLPLDTTLLQAVHAEWLYSSDVVDATALPPLPPPNLFLRLNPLEVCIYIMMNWSAIIFYFY